MTLSRDKRDSVLDATRGEFSSHSLEFGPGFLGSEIGFTRYYGQYFRYVALDKFLLKKPSAKEKKSAPKKLIYAGALRLGLTTAFEGGSVISPERFFAGGGTTMRGFEQDMLGPTETLEDGTVRPTGGEALFLFNNEIRFPIFGILHGVGFVDIGNVYQRISDFDFTMRKSAGSRPAPQNQIHTAPFRLRTQARPQARREPGSILLQHRASVLMIPDSRFEIRDFKRNFGY